MKDIFGRDIPDNFRITMRRDVFAEALWEYGEDTLAQRLLQESDEGLDQVQPLGWVLRAPACAQKPWFTSEVLDTS